jgi:hypothetical protein
MANTLENFTPTSEPTPQPSKEKASKKKESLENPYENKGIEELVNEVDINDLNKKQLINLIEAIDIFSIKDFEETLLNDRENNETNLLKLYNLGQEIIDKISGKGSKKLKQGLNANLETIYQLMTESAPALKKAKRIDSTKPSDKSQLELENEVTAAARAREEEVTAAARARQEEVIKKRDEELKSLVKNTGLNTKDSKSTTDLQYDINWLMKENFDSVSKKSEQEARDQYNLVQSILDGVKNGDIKDIKIKKAEIQQLKELEELLMAQLVENKKAVSGAPERRKRTNEAIAPNIKLKSKAELEKQFFADGDEIENPTPMSEILGEKDNRFDPLLFSELTSIKEEDKPKQYENYYKKYNDELEAREKELKGTKLNKKDKKEVLDYIKQLNESIELLQSQMIGSGAAEEAAKGYKPDAKKVDLVRFSKEKIMSKSIQELRDFLPEMESADSEAAINALQSEIEHLNPKDEDESYQLDKINERVAILKNELVGIPYFDKTINDLKTELSQAKIETDKQPIKAMGRLMTAMKQEYETKDMLQAYKEELETTKGFGKRWSIKRNLSKTRNQLEDLQKSIEKNLETLEDTGAFSGLSSSVTKRLEDARDKAADIINHKSNYGGK